MFWYTVLYANMKNKYTIALIVVLVGIIGYFAYSVFFPHQESGVPHPATLTGEYLCLPYSDNVGAQEGPCALGIKTDAGVYYALDFRAITEPSAELAVGDRMRASGLLVPLISVHHAA